jgi:hypothetical protein
MRFEQKVFGRIAAKRELRKRYQISADLVSSSDVVQDLSGVSREITNRGVDLGKRYANRVHENQRPVVDGQWPASRPIRV